MDSDRRTDEVLGETKWVAGVIVLVLLTASALLYIWPDKTAQTFAWTIKPSMTSLFMGSAYGAGVYYFARVFTARRWHWVAADLPAIVVFTSFLGVATLLHYDRFNHAHISFYVWLALYVTTPFLITVLWLRNRKTDPGTFDARDAEVSKPVRAVSATLGALVFAACMFAFIRPASLIQVWPWTLTPLTARVLIGFFSWFGTIAISLAADRRWSAWRVIVQSQLIGLFLIVLGAVRAWDDFQPSNPLSAGFVGSGVGMWIVLGWFYLHMERRMARSIAA